jgi:hypothetical protein
MALTFSNRETFLVLHWLESQPGRQRYFTDLARSLARVNTDAAVSRLAEALLVALERELPKLDGIADAMLQAALSRVAFHELALALVLQTGSSTRPLDSRDTEKE